MDEFEGTNGTWTFDRSNQLGPTGGFGSVFLGSGPAGQPAAVKIVPPIEGGDGDALRRREVSILQRTNEADSKRLIRMFDIGMAGIDLCIALELADGSLETRSSGLPINEVVDTVLDIALGLADLHSAGIFHRDLKPGNILYVGDRLVLSDFGIARDSELGTQSVTFVGAGSAPYMAPELWSLASPTAKSDLYALGIIAYELLTGERPFKGDRENVKKGHVTLAAPELTTDIPEALRKLVTRLLSKQPTSRPADARAVVERLERINAPLSEAQSTIAARVLASDERTSRQHAAEALHQERTHQFTTLQEQAFGDLGEILHDAIELLRSVDERFELVGPAGSQSWLVKGPYTKLEIYLTGWTGPLSDEDPIVSMAEVKKLSGQTQFTLANLVYEKTPNGNRWNIYRFERHALVRQYRLGPPDHEHGFDSSNFRKQRPYMLTGGMHIWTKRVERLTDDLLVGLVAEASQDH